MPRGFTEQERAAIRDSLLEKGKEHFGRLGLQKTNVEDLTRAVGISKGAFYLFYSSKEELFFDLLEQFEAEIKRALLGDIAEIAASPRDALKGVLMKTIAIWKSNALFAHFSNEEFARLVRKLPAERVRDHQRADDAFAADFATAWKARGVELRHEPRIISGLIRALFFVSLHEDDFGDGVYPDVIDMLTEVVADRLVGS